MLLYYPLSGLITLFANTLQNPQDPQVASDLKLMEIVVSYLSEPLIHVNQMTATTARIFAELVNMAKKYVEKTNSQGSKAMKRGHDEPVAEEDNSRLPQQTSKPSWLTNINLGMPVCTQTFTLAAPSRSTYEARPRARLTRRYELIFTFVSSYPP